MTALFTLHSSDTKIKTYIIVKPIVLISISLVVQSKSKIDLDFEKSTHIANEKSLLYI